MSEGSERLRWPIEGEALLVDDDPLVRQAYAARLNQAGCHCHEADSYRNAQELLEGNSRISVVLLDHGVQGDDTEEFVTVIRRSRPGVLVVASSGRDCRAEFSELGVDRFLRKPWSLGQLFDLVSNRLSQCALCGIALPLRQPLIGEEATGWACAFCGARYRAVLDHDAPPESCRNVREVDFPASPV